MDKDDPDSGKPQDLFEDESAFEEAPEGATLPQGEEDAGEWHEQPVDDLAESGEAYVEEVATPGDEAHEQVEDEFAPAGAEGMEGTDGTDGTEDDASSARENAEQYLPPEEASSKPDLMKYLPYVGVGSVLLVLGFFGFQQMSNMMGGGQEAMLTPPPMQTTSAPPPPAQTPSAPPPPSPSSPPVGSTASSGEYILNPNAPPPPPLPSTQLSPPATAANVDNLEQQLSALNNRLDDMKRNQERIEEQLRNIQNAPPPPNLPTPDPAAQNSLRMLEEKFAVLEQRINPASPSSTAPAKSGPSASAPEAASAGETDKPAAAKPKKKKTARKKTSPLPGQWQQPTGAYRPQVASWILRSAQPGTAWLSQGMSSELQRVVPGDKLPGLGTIVSVRMVAGRWLVEGTQGSVR